MQRTNYYGLLDLAADAPEEVIEEAYNRLFDSYEADAQAGDPEAVEMLRRLNEAHETLTDPASRAAYDASLASESRPARPASGGADPAERPSAGRKRTGTRTATASTRDTATTVAARKRAVQRPRSVQPAQRSRPVLPYILVTLLGIGLLASLVYLLTRVTASVPEKPAGNVLATVNGVPIYERELEERAARDKENALADPFIQVAINNFQGITGTRALDILRYDALDKLINLEVIQQQAKKENKYPGPEQQAEIIQAAKEKELRPGESFDDFLRRVGVSAAQYNKRVIENFVYVLMAEEHMPKAGDNASRTDAFLKWICDTRKNYDTRVLMSFIVKENQPCTSGLPTDLPLPGMSDETPVPEPVATEVPPALPAKTQGP